MASFDAGSIDGRLELDTDPFTSGLDMAEARADEWEAKPIRKRVELDTRAASAAMDEFDTREDSKEIHQRVDVDTKPAERKLDEFRARERAKNAQQGGGGGGAALAGLAIPAAIAGALGPIPALSPMISGATMGSAVAASGFAQFAAFGLLEKSLITSAAKSAQTAVTAKKATEAQIQVVDNLKDVSEQWDKLAMSPAMMKLLSRGTGFLDQFIPKLQPLVNSISTGLMPAIDGLSKYSTSSQFKGFEKMLEGNAQSLLPKWLATVGKTGQGLVGVMEAVNPELVAFTDRVDNMAGKFSRWGNDGGAKKFFDNMNAYDAQFRAPLGQLGHDTVGAGKNLFGSNGLGNPVIVNGAIKELDGLFGTIAHADMKPLIGAITGIQSLETSIGHGINAGGVLPAALNTVGSLTKTLSQVNWTVVGNGLKYFANGIKDVSDVLRVINKGTDGMLGTAAGLGVLGFGASKIPGVSGLVSKVLGKGKGDGYHVWVDNMGIGGGGGGVGGLAKDAEKVAEGAGGATVLGALKNLIKGGGITNFGQEMYGALDSGGPLSKGILSSAKGLSRLGLASDGLAVMLTTPNFLPNFLGGENNKNMQHVGTSKFGGFYGYGTQSLYGKIGLPGLDPQSNHGAGPMLFFPKGNTLTGLNTPSLDYGGVLPGSPIFKQLTQLAQLQQHGLGGIHGFSWQTATNNAGQSQRYLQYTGSDKQLAAVLSKLTTLLDKGGNLDPSKIVASQKADYTALLKAQHDSATTIAAMLTGTYKGTPLATTGGLPLFAGLTKNMQPGTTIQTGTAKPAFGYTPFGQIDWTQISKADEKNFSTLSAKFDPVVTNTGKTNAGIDLVHGAIGTLTDSQVSAAAGAHADASNLASILVALQSIMAGLPGSIGAAVKGAQPTQAQITQAVRAATGGNVTTPTAP